MRRVFTLIIVAAVAVGCVRLGIWQLHRLHDRRERNAEVRARLAASEVSLQGDVPDTLAFRRTHVSGTWDFEHQIVVVGRPLQGVPGVHVVTPLLLDWGAAILVERGWAPSPDARMVDVSGLREDESAEVQGVLLAPLDGSGSAGSEWPIVVQSANPGLLASRFPYPLVPLVLRRTERPASGLPPLMRLVPLPELTDGPHLSYTVQWFAFALIAVVGGIALDRRQAKDAQALADHR